jgi:ubiquinone/menaquinone biosynthesis C-methylase UbiE
MNDNHFFNSRAATWDADPDRLARACAVADGIRSAVPIDPAWRALEYGCGTGLLSFALAPALTRVTLADNSEGMLAELRKKIAAAGAGEYRVLMLDLATDPPPDERYDILYTMMTLHHIDDVAGILRSFHTLLASPGTLCVADLDAEDGSFHDPGFTGHHGFQREEFRRQVEAAGFRNVRFSTAYRVPRGQPPREYPVFLMVAEK